MSEVKTFDCEGCRPYCYGGYHMEDDRDGDGDYVKTADYKQLRQQLEAAKEQAAAAQAENLRLRMFLDQLARLGNEPLLGSSTGNRIAQAALAQPPSREALDAYVAERVIAIQVAEARINKPENEEGK